MIFEDKCYAKINLFLYNLGKRNDGYHELYTLFYRINLYDTLFIERADRTTLSCDMPGVPSDENNIILKVDHILRADYGLKDNYLITLSKRIPPGSGLGGGSSDAATYITLVNKASVLGLSIEQMAHILSRVGSDAPFFLFSPVAIGRGRGEILTPVKNFMELYIVLVVPDIFISTAAVFSSGNLRSTTLNNLHMLNQLTTFDELLACMKNDLEPAAFSVSKEVENIKSAVQDAGAIKALMSGAGSSVFGIFRTQEERDFGYNMLKEKFHNYLVEIV